jgi:hypothetical protein
MTALLLSALGLTAVTVVTHGVGTVSATGRVIRFRDRRRDRPGWLGTERLTV